MSLNRVAYELASKIVVEKVSLRGPGVLILTGPSSCGKGEIASALSRVMSIPPQNHLSMGEILRSTFQRAKNEKSYAKLLESSYQISANSNIFDCVDSKEEGVELLSISVVDFVTSVSVSVSVV